MKPLDKPYYLDLDGAQGGHVIRQLLDFEGDLLDHTADVASEWLCGIIVVPSAQGIHFAATSVYGKYLLDRFSAEAPEPPAHAADGEKFVVLGTGRGNPEAFRIAGPVTDEVIALLAKPAIADHLGFLVGPTPLIPPSEPVPARLVAVLDGFHSTLPSPPRPLAAAVAPSRYQYLVDVGKDLVDYVLSQSDTLYALERAQIRLEIAKSKLIVAKAMVAAGIR